MPNGLYIYLCKKTVIYIQCKGDIVVVDIKQHKSQVKNSNFAITQSAKLPPPLTWIHTAHC